MSTTTTPATAPAPITASPARAADRTPRPAPEPIPFTRLLGVELTKMFDTRSGRWLTTSVAVTALIATAAVIAFAPDTALTFDTFGTAVGVPMAVLLPVLALLSVTSEYTQRSGLTTFTLVPHRHRVVRAKLVASVLVGIVGIAVALGTGAVGNLVGSSVAGVDTVWDVSAAQLGGLVLAYVLLMLVGFMLGVLIRNSPGAIVAYFVYNFVLSTLTMALAAYQPWFADLQPWVDFNAAQAPFFDGTFDATAWAHLAVTGSLWLVLPLAVGLWLVGRSEVK
ncbi:ABC transporter permease subunit [Nocardioides flavescens]|uniref:ABC transporter permease subunit n=1 Tax=Nocardioides flavescens TaxID=2691959 RepID=A0A6L7F091_9ACTN|nr:ABC transporter permease subunit [Nocardioides flavescens]MXG88134.1 ABC transporter permease subunit [Nocardioides flavescens]